MDVMYSIEDDLLINVDWLFSLTTSSGASNCAIPKCMALMMPAGSCSVALEKRYLASSSSSVSSQYLNCRLTVLMRNSLRLDLRGRLSHPECVNWPQCDHKPRDMYSGVCGRCRYRCLVLDLYPNLIEAELARCSWCRQYSCLQ